MNRLKIEKRIQVLSSLVEGVSINATCRMTGVAKHTVLKLLEELGCAVPYTIIGMSVTFGCGVCSAMRFGLSSEQSRRVSALKRKRKDGATFGRGPRLMLTRNSASPTSWADAIPGGRPILCLTAPIASLAVRRSPRTHTSPI